MQFYLQRHSDDRIPHWRVYNLGNVFIQSRILMWSLSKNMNKKKHRPLLFERHYATFWLKEKTYYANVKENLITEVNVISWLWDRPIKDTK